MQVNKNDNTITLVNINDHLRSEDMIEIISNKPSGLSKWTLFIFITLLIILGCSTWFIHYPDVVKTRATLLCNNSPCEIIIRKEGRLKGLFVTDGQIVSKGYVLGFIECDANIESVMKLKNSLDTSLFELQRNIISKMKSRFGSGFNDLGEIQQNYQLFKIAYNQFTEELKNRASMKNGKGTISGVDYYQNETDFNTQKDRFILSIQILQNLVNEWIQKYTLQANVDGRISFFMPVQQNQYFTTGRVVGYIIPSNSTYYVQGNIQQNYLGKVKKGQIVQIQFDAYPFQEFGFVKGTLENITTGATDKEFIANITLNNGLITSLNKTIPLRHGLTGQANIITKDIRLVDRFYIKSLSLINQ